MTSRLQVIFSHLEHTGNTEWLPKTNTASTSSLPSPQRRKFRFTQDGCKLSEEERAFYEENGFVVIKRLVAPEKLDVYRDRFAQICKREVKVPNLTIMRDIAIKDSEFVPGEQAVTKIQEFQHDDVLFGYCCLPEVVDYVESFTGPNIMAIHTMLINKPPDAGKMTSRHPMHQDLYYFPFRPADGIVCSWTAMQTVNRRNGCLVVVPGSHKGKLLTHTYPEWEGGVNKMYHGIQDYDPSCPRVHLEMEEGDTVFFHPLLIHGSGTNRTQGFRKSISCHYANSKSEVLKEVEPEQKLIKDEVISVTKKKLGEALLFTFQDLWMLKSRHIRGQASDQNVSN